MISTTLILNQQFPQASVAAALSAVGFIKTSVPLKKAIVTLLQSAGLSEATLSLEGRVIHIRSSTITACFTKLNLDNPFLYTSIYDTLKQLPITEPSRELVDRIHSVITNLEQTEGWVSLKEDVISIIFNSHVSYDFPEFMPTHQPCNTPDTDHKPLPDAPQNSPDEEIAGITASSAANTPFSPIDLSTIVATARIGRALSYTQFRDPELEQYLESSPLSKCPHKGK